MNATRTRISARRLGFAVGATAALFRLGCILTFMTVPREHAIHFFNNLLYGVDLAPILREKSPGETVIGLVAVFVLGWFAGALVALFYNAASAIRLKRS